MLQKRPSSRDRGDRLDRTALASAPNLWSDLFISSPSSHKAFLAIPFW
jgi:hypothetical protein